MAQTKLVSEMSASAINKELDYLDSKRSKLGSEFIEAGRGHETNYETMELSDPLALKFQAIQNRQLDFTREVERRAGPKMRRLPRGFGPIKDY